VPTAGSGGCTGASVKRGRGCPVLGTARSRKPSTGQSRGLRPCWGHLRDSVFTKTPEREEEGTKRRNSRGNTKVRRGGGAPWWGRYPSWKDHAGAEERCEKKGAVD